MFEFDKKEADKTHASRVKGDFGYIYIYIYVYVYIYIYSLLSRHKRFMTTLSRMQQMSFSLLNSKDTQEALYTRIYRCLYTAQQNLLQY